MQLSNSYLNTIYHFILKCMTCRTYIKKVLFRIEVENWPSPISPRLTVNQDIYCLFLKTLSDSSFHEIFWHWFHSSFPGLNFSAKAQSLMNTNLVHKNIYYRLALVNGGPIRVCFMISHWSVSVLCDSILQNNRSHKSFKFWLMWCTIAYI